MFRSLCTLFASRSSPDLNRVYPDDASERLKDLAHLIRLAASYESGQNFSAIALGDGLNSSDEPIDGVVLSTVHRAKGLEWAAVFIVGLYEGGFPLVCAGITDLDERDASFTSD